MKNQKIILTLTGILLLSSFFIGSYFFKNQEIKSFMKNSRKNKELFEREYSPVYGNKDAKVTIVEFLDPECETCRKFHPLVKQLMAENENKIKLVIRYAPFHKNSKFVIKILEAAKKQNKFWPALEILFRFQPKWGGHHNPRPELVWEYLPLVGIDIEKIKKDMNDPSILKILAQDQSDGEELKVKKTPSFFVNQRPLKSFGYVQLKEAIERELKK